MGFTHSSSLITHRHFPIPITIRSTNLMTNSIKGHTMASDLGFIDPTFGNDKPKIALARRPADLADKVIGMIDNTKEQANVILQAMADAMRERYGVARVIVRTKEH